MWFGLALDPVVYPPEMKSLLHITPTEPRNSQLANLRCPAPQGATSTGASSYIATENRSDEVVT